MSTTLATLFATCAPLVHPTTLHALIRVESAANPYAVSINRPKAHANAGTLPSFRQPRSAREAVAIITALHAQGFTTSVGLAQINTEHLPTLGLSVSALLDPCTNLSLAQRILLDCAAQARQGGQSLPAVLSCFNSGNPRTGIANGYAARIRTAAIKASYNNTNRSLDP